MINLDNMILQPEQSKVVDVPPALRGKEFTVRGSFESFLATQPQAFRLGTRMNNISGGGVTFWTLAGVPNIFEMEVRGPVKSLIFTRNIESPSSTHQIGLTNITLTEGVGSLHGPKVPFAEDNQNNVSVDARGIYVDRKPYVVCGMYTDHRRDNWKLYADKGFNTSMWVTSPNMANKAYDVGMKFFFGVTAWLWEGGWGYPNYGVMRRNLDTILTSHAGNNMLGFYLDNEAYTQYRDIVAQLELLIRDYGFPVYILNGQEGIAPRYAQAGVQQITGSYIGAPNSPGGGNGYSGLRYLNNHQSSPVHIAQVNSRRGSALSEAMGAIDERLARGWAHWSDHPDRPVTSTAWWDEVGEFNQEFKERVLELNNNELPPIEPPPPDPPDTQEGVLTLDNGDQYEVSFRKISR